MSRPSLAYVIDPRLPGGTSSVVAQELPHAAALSRLTVHAISSVMMKDRRVAPVLATEFERLNIQPVWDAPRIEADVVVLHNPAFLKFDTEFPTRITCRRLIVVTHENLVRPGGAEAFDVGQCLRLIDRASLALEKWLMPVSAYNRSTAEEWLCQVGNAWPWSLADDNWIEICDFEFAPPRKTPRDRRGRHSRPGFEKFPPLSDLDLSFPTTAEVNRFLGGDTLRTAAIERPHWDVQAFGSVPVDHFLGTIDFFVYHTAPTWRESFGRVLVEAAAAGIAVITDEATAATLGPGAISAAPSDVSARIDDLCRDRDAYAETVTAVQAHIAEAYAPEAFRAALLRLLAG